MLLFLSKVTESGFKESLWQKHHLTFKGEMPVSKVSLLMILKVPLTANFKSNPFDCRLPKSCSQVKYNVKKCTNKWAHYNEILSLTVRGELVVIFFPTLIHIGSHRTPVLHRCHAVLNEPHRAIHHGAWWWHKGITTQLAQPRTTHTHAPLTTPTVGHYTGVTHERGPSESMTSSYMVGAHLLFSERHLSFRSVALCKPVV